MRTRAERRRLGRPMWGAAASLATVLTLAAPALAEEPAGDWLGTIQGSQGEAHFLLHVRRRADGVYTGDQDDLDYCVKGLPVASLQATATTLSYVFPPTGARFEARWNEAARRWSGSYGSQKAAYPMELVRLPAGPRGVRLGVSFRLVDASGDPAAHQGETRVAFKDGELWLEPDVAISGEMVASARARPGADGRPVVDITLNETGKARLDSVTRAHIGRRMAILVDGKVVAAPVIRDEMAQGLAEIAGDFSTADACLMAEEIAPGP